MNMFTVAGVSTVKGLTKVRFANDLVSRVKMLVKAGHTDVELYELPEPMTKAEACDYLRYSGLSIMQLPHLAEAVAAAWDKYHSAGFAKTTKVTKMTVNIEDLRARAEAATGKTTVLL
jgi:hypothetical protein